MASGAAGTALHMQTAQWSAFLKSSRPLRPKLAVSQAMPALSVGYGTARRAMVRAEYRQGGGGSDFFAGFVLGGVVFGALGYLVAPQLTKSFSEVARTERVGGSKKGPKYLEEEDNYGDYPKPERQAENPNDGALSAADQKTRKTLVEKIAQLNAAIDDISAQLSADEKLDKFNELETAA